MPSFWNPREWTDHCSHVIYAANKSMLATKFRELNFGPKKLNLALFKVMFCIKNPNAKMLYNVFESESFDGRRQFLDTRCNNIKGIYNLSTMADQVNVVVV